MATKHAVLSASSSERWLNCPPSARLCESYEDKGSDYAAEGTDAHSLCEYRLQQALGITADDPIDNLTWYNEEMEECAVGYAAYVCELLETAKQTCTDPVVMIEQRVDFSRWVQDGFGTADCIIIADGILNIVDYKHGKRYNEIYKLQLPNITPHICRHTYCSNMARSGMNPKTLQYLMGHSEIGVTMNTYTHLGLEDAQTELQRMEELNAARKELEKTQGERTVSKAVFRVV